MEQYIIDYLHNHKYKYIKINEIEYITHIYYLFKYDMVQLKKHIYIQILSLYYGIYYNIKKDYTNGIKYLIPIAKRGNMHSINILARCYYKNGDYGKSVHWCLIGIKNNNPSLMCQLGRYYYFQRHNYNESKKYYLMAIDNGNIKANHYMGIYYHKNGKYDKAIKYYKMYLGNNNGCGIKKMKNNSHDYSYNLKHITKPTNRDHACKSKKDIILIEISKCYHKIDNIDESMKYLLIAAEKGNNDAMVSLGHYYYKNKNYNKALEYLYMCDETTKEYKKYAINIGHCYYKMKMYKIAGEYYLIALGSKQSAAAANCLGNCGKLMRNYELMEMWYLLAIKQNNTCAMNNLAYYYYSNKSYKEAIKYFSMAVKNNDVSHIDYLIKTYELVVNGETINDAIELTHKYGKMDEKYGFIIKALYNGYNISRFHTLNNYIYTTNVQFQIMKHNRKTCDHKNLFINLKNILMLLKTISIYKIPKYIINDIIYYITKL